MSGEPIARWQKITAGLVLAANVVLVVLWRGRLSADFWPPDASRVAPNLLASILQWEVVLIAAALLWPPTRRRIHRLIDAKADSIKAHVTALHATADADRAELHRKLDHVIRHHPDIPPLPDDPEGDPS